MVANWIMIALLLVMSHQARRPQTQALEVEVSGVTTLSDEKTQAFSTRELAQVGVGEIHPIMAINAEQVRLTLAGLPIGDEELFAGDEEMTQAVNQDRLPDSVFTASARGGKRVEDIFIEDTPVIKPTPVDDFDDDDYFVRGEE